MRIWLRRLGWVAVALGVMWLLAGLVSVYVQPADSGEMQLVVRDLGVAHPPGYALYTMLAHAFGRVAGQPSIAAALGFDPAIVAGDDYLGGADRWSWSSNLFSALLATLSLLTVLGTARLLTRSTACGLLAAVTLALTPTFMAQSAVANIRMPTALVTALLMYLTIRWLERGPPAASTESTGLRHRIDWGVVATAFVAGLAVGHHPSLAPVAALAALLMVVRRPSVLRDGSTLVASLVALIASLLPLLYLPVRDRAGAALAPGGLDTLGGLIGHVTGFGFRGDVLGPGDSAALADRALVVWNVALIQFGPLLLLLAAVGAIWLLARHRLSGLLLVGTALGTALLAVVYRAPQTMEYLIPAYVALAVLVGSSGGAIRVAVGWLIARMSRSASGSDSPDGREEAGGNARPGTQAEGDAEGTGSSRGDHGGVGHGDVGDVGSGDVGDVGSGDVGRVGRAAGTVVVLVLCAAVVLARRDLPAQVVDAQPSPWSVIDVLDPECTPEDSTVLASWHHVTPLWYEADGTMPRPDLDIEYVYPEGAEPIGETWRRRLDETGSPAVVTNRSGEMISAGSALQPLPGTPFFTTERTGCARLNGDFDEVTPVGATFGDLVVLEKIHMPDVAVPSPKTPMLAELRASGSVDEPLTVFAQLVDPASGTVYGQVDRTVSPERWNDPEGLLVRLPIEPFRERLGALQLLVGVYRHTDDGLERLDPRLSDRTTENADDVFPLPGPDHTVAVGTVGTMRRVLGSPPRHPNALIAARDAALGLERGFEIEAGPPVDVDPPDDAIPFGDAMWLVGSDVRHEGDQLVVDLTWLAEHAYVSDFVVSVQAEGDGLFAQHDGIPAQGAIPTLKWLPGMVARDRHRIDLPSDVSAETPITVSVGVYDAFSLEPLPVTRRDLAAAGQGQRAVIAGEAF